MASVATALAIRATRVLIQCALLSTCLLAAASSREPAVVLPNAIGDLVADVCKKQTVLLGEDGSHGSGATLEAKVEIVRRLVDECGFNAVYFESAIYDFIDLQRRFKKRSASPEMLADAIGGIWSTTSETDPLIAFLYAQAEAGKIYLAGLDPQLGSATSVYTKSELPTELSAVLGDVRSKQCAFEIQRLTNWNYRDNQQYLDARVSLRRCALDMQKRIAGSENADVDGVAALLTENFLRHIDLSSGDTFNKRDKAMYDNFLWHQAHMRGRRKTIIWCATVHAAKLLHSFGAIRRSLGSFIHALQHDNAATIGFTALGGAYGRNGQGPISLTPAASDSLESRAFEGAHGEMVYLSHQKLVSLGLIFARALDYAESDAADWSDIVDGMVVLRNERPPNFVRNARPRQAGPEGT